MRSIANSIRVGGGESGRKRRDKGQRMGGAKETEGEKETARKGDKSREGKKGKKGGCLDDEEARIAMKLRTVNRA